MFQLRGGAGKGSAIVPRARGLGVSVVEEGQAADRGKTMTYLYLLIYQYILSLYRYKTMTYLYLLTYQYILSLYRYKTIVVRST